MAKSKKIKETVMKEDKAEKKKQESDSSSDSDCGFFDKKNKFEVSYNAPESPKATEIELGKWKKLECPFKNEDSRKICRLTEKQKSDQNDFRRHLFLHYRDSQEWITYWDERLKNMKKGEQLSMYCDLCKKKINAVTPNGLRNSMICHLALFHDELRHVLEKDDKMTKDFIKSVFYDIDLKKIWKNVVNEATKIGKRTKTKPVPKSRMKPNEKPKGPLVNVDNHDEIPDISSDEPEVWESKPKHKINKKSPAPTASKKTSAIKSKSKSGKVSPDPVLRPNNEVVRKRRPINFTLGTINILRN